MPDIQKIRTQCQEGFEKNSLSHITVRGIPRSAAMQQALKVLKFRVQQENEL